jgi:anti-sigma B factor antagonist
MDARTVSWEGEAPMALNKANASEFGMKERQVGEVTILELKGRVALGEGAQTLNDKLQTLIEQGRLKLLLQCSEVTILDSQGISSLVRGVISTRKRGGQLKLLKLSPRAHRVLDITHLLTFIQSFEDEAEALASF